MNGHEGRDEDVGEDVAVACDYVLDVVSENLDHEIGDENKLTVNKRVPPGFLEKVVSANCRFNAGSCCRHGFGRSRLAKTLDKYVPVSSTFTPFRDERAGNVILFYAFREPVGCENGLDGRPLSSGRG